MQASRLPQWIRAPLPSRDYGHVREILARHALTTVCREAHCPNLPECWSQGTATLMLLGDTCTRRCAFCAVATVPGGGAVDPTEPGRVAQAVGEWKLRYVVLTMVARDDLEDHGAGHLARTIREIRARTPGMGVEMLVSDLGGRAENLDRVLQAGPEVLAHNVETVPRLTASVRDGRASFERSIHLLRMAKEGPSPAAVTKSSIMLGLGETREEVEDALRSLREAGVDIVTLGQYLRPGGEGFHETERFAPPEEFADLARSARALGFRGVASGPMVRSSYMAEELYRAAVGRPR